MPEKHTVSTPHGTLQFEGAFSNGERVVLVTLSKPFFPAFSFCLSDDEALNTVDGLLDALDDADHLKRKP